MEHKNHRILEKSLEILDIISQNSDGMILAQITKEIDMPKSSVHSIVHTFTNLGYLNKDSRTSSYTLGIKAFEIGSRYTENQSFLRYAKKILEKVSTTCDETAHLATLDGTDVVYIYKFESSQAIRMVSNIGKRNQAHATAIGKALLSGMSDDNIIKLYSEKELSSMTDFTITDMDVLLSQIRDIRVSGIAYEKEESTLGVQCFAMPIITDTNDTKAAISVSIPVFRIQEDSSIYINALLEGKRALEELIL